MKLVIHPISNNQQRKTKKKTNESNLNNLLFLGKKAKIPPKSIKENINGEAKRNHLGENQVVGIPYIIRQ